MKTATSICANGNVGTAVFSDDMRHRDLLTRAPLLAEAQQGFPLFVMLNPSTATEVEDDPTIRRCFGFARRLGYHSFRICNLFSFRATDPKAMMKAGGDVAGDPVNMEMILANAAEAEIVICAWGGMGCFRLRDDYVARALRGQEMAKMRCLGRNGDGSPRHPLFLQRDTKLRQFTGLGFVGGTDGT